MLAASPTPVETAGRVSAAEASGHRLQLAAFLCVAFVVRLFFVRFQDVINTDGIYYVTLARHLMDGNFNAGLSAYWPPLYPLLAGIASLVFKDVEFAARFVSILSGTLLVLPVYCLTREIYGRS